MCVCVDENKIISLTFSQLKHATRLKHSMHAVHSTAFWNDKSDFIYFFCTASNEMKMHVVKQMFFKMDFVNTVLWLLVHPTLFFKFFYFFFIAEWQTTTSVKNIFACVKDALRYSLLAHCHI